MKTKKLLLFILLTLLLSCEKTSKPKVYTGIIEGKVYSVSSPLEEKIISLSKEEGDKVTKGETVVIIDTTELSLQIRQLNSALNELKIQLQSTKIQIEEAKNNVNYFSDLYSKNLDLYNKKVLPLQKLKDIKLKLDNARKQLEFIALNKDLISEKIEQTNIKKQLVKEKLSKAIITSPSNGIVDKIYYEEGEILIPLSPIMEIVNLDEVWCYIYVSEVELVSIKPGEKVKIFVDGYDGTLTGTIAHINNQAEFTPKNIMTPDNRRALVFGVKILIQNPESLLKPGMPVEVKL